MDESETEEQLGRRVASLALAAAALASCQSYEPRSLDPAVHRETWHGRSLADGSLRELVERLERDLGERVAAFDPDDGLTLREGQLVALVFHPDLRLARLRAERAAASAEHAGLWDDPELALTGLRITEDVSDRWFLAADLAFTVPLSGRLAAEREHADAARLAAERRALEAEWDVLHAVRRAWVAWTSALHRADETERFAGALDALVETTARLAETGELPRTEASLFAVERARRSNQLGRLRGEVAAAEQRLRASMGLAPAVPVTLVPTLAVAESEDGGMEAIAERNPGLARLRAEYEVAEATLRREIRKRYPDLTLGPSYESDEGQSRIGLFGAIPLPFLNANRRAIAEARAGREIARAAYEAEYESLAGRWSAASALAGALEAQRADVERLLVPLVDRQVEDALQLVQLGEGTSLVLLESLTRAHEVKLDLIETRAAEALARAELAHLTGPPTEEETP